jgi:hypothetical protein
MKRTKRARDLGKGFPPKDSPRLDGDARTPPLGPKLGSDPLLALRGSGREVWADEHADDYVRRLRES